MFGQTITADVVGRVLDGTGAVVPAAKVTVTNLGTNNVRSAETSDTGEYTVNLLPPGRYSIRVEHAGFKAFNVNDLNLVS